MQNRNVFQNLSPPPAKQGGHNPLQKILCHSTTFGFLPVGLQSIDDVKIFSLGYFGSMDYHDGSVAKQ